VRVETLFTGFANRTEAGKSLSRALSEFNGKPDAIVLGLPRGGVITAAAVAEALGLPLDVLVVRKLGTPGHEELAMGAIGPAGVRVINDDVIASYGIDRGKVESAIRFETVELERRERVYRSGEPPLDLEGKTVIVVDDGLATGATMSAAIEAVRAKNAARIILAVPVAPMEILERFRFVVDELVYLETPEPFGAVGYWYVDFSQVDDGEVIRALQKSRDRFAALV
jgi:putative phosphoribosyl transferase